MSHLMITILVLLAAQPPGTAPTPLGWPEYAAKRTEWQRRQSERDSSRTTGGGDVRSVEIRRKQEACLAPFASSMLIDDGKPGLVGVNDHQEIDAIPQAESSLSGRFMIRKSQVFLSEKKDLIYTVLEAQILSKYKGSEQRRSVTILNPGGRLFVESGGALELRFDGRAQPGPGQAFLFLRSCGTGYVLLSGYEVRPWGLLPLWDQAEHLWYLGKGAKDLETAVRKAAGQ